MKKLILIILASLLFNIVCYANDGLTPKQIEETRALCKIDKEYTPEYYKKDEVNGSYIYYYEWKDSNNKVMMRTITGDNGFVYKYSLISSMPVNKNNAYTIDDGKIAADNFLKNILCSEYGNVKFENYLESGPTNICNKFYYNIYSNGVKYSNSNIYIKVDVNKYTNQVNNYSYPVELHNIKKVSFNNSKDIGEIENNIIDGFELCYKFFKDDETGQKTVKLVYMPKSQFINVFDMTNISAIYDYEGYINMTSESSDSWYDRTEIQNKACLSHEKAVEIFNDIIVGNRIDKSNLLNLYNTKLSVYTSAILLRTNYAYDIKVCEFDSKGRLINYNGTFDYSTVKKTDVELSAKAKKIIGELNVSNYKLKPMVTRKIKWDNSDDYFYEFTSQIERNGYGSYDEGIQIRLTDYGELIGVYCNYLDDYIFEKPNSIISSKNAFEIAKRNYGLDKYFYVDYSIEMKKENHTCIIDYKDELIYKSNATPVYGFNSGVIYVDAETGVLLDYYGNEVE